MATTIQTQADVLHKAFAANATTSSFPSKVPTLTEPTGDGVINLCESGGTIVTNQLQIIPIGTTTANTVFYLKVIGWKTIKENDVEQWIPTTLCQITCTLGAMVGVAASPVLDTQKFCDTLAVTIGNVGVDVEVVSPADDTIAHAIVDMKGSRKAEILIDRVDAASANALYSRV